MRLMRLVFAALMLAGSVASAQAAFINLPVPTNAYITLNGYDWAWANPLPGADLSYQGALGWRIPTAAELAFAPLATDFLIAGGNVPFNGVDPISGALFEATNSAYTNAASAGAVAVPYFSTVFHHADWVNGLGQPTGPWVGMAGAFSFGEQLVVRDASAPVVPEPTSMALAGFAGIGMAVGAWRRRRQQAT